MQDNKYTADISGHFKKLATKLLRMLLWLIAITASIGAVAYLYSAYEEHKELTYMTSDKCSKHDYQTQICEAEDESLYLRHVEIANNRMSVSMLVDNPEWDTVRFQYRAFWFEDCDTGIEVETDRLYSDGTPFVLRCTSRSEIYLKSSAPPRLGLAFTGEFQSGMKFNFGGFIIDHDYSQTDYSSLLRQHTLRNTAVERERKARQEQEAKEREARQEQEAKEKEARKEREAKVKEAIAEKERQERLAQKKKKQACEKSNELAKIKHEKDYLAAKEFWLNDDYPLGYRCTDWGSDNPYARKRSEFTICKSLRITIKNTTKYEVERLNFGFEENYTCASAQYNNYHVFSLLPDKTFIKDVYLLNIENMNKFCMKVNEVSLKKIPFLPKKCF